MNGFFKKVPSTYILVTKTAMMFATGLVLISFQNCNCSGNENAFTSAAGTSKLSVNPATIGGQSTGGQSFCIPSAGGCIVTILPINCTTGSQIPCTDPVTGVAGLATCMANNQGYGACVTSNQGGAGLCAPGFTFQPGTSSSNPGSCVADSACSTVGTAANCTVNGQAGLMTCQADLTYSACTASTSTPVNGTVTINTPSGPVTVSGSGTDTTTGNTTVVTVTGSNGTTATITGTSSSSGNGATTVTGNGTVSGGGNPSSSGSGTATVTTNGTTTSGSGSVTVNGTTVTGSGTDTNNGNGTSTITVTNSNGVTGSVTGSSSTDVNGNTTVSGSGSISGGSSTTVAGTGTATFGGSGSTSGGNNNLTLTCASGQILLGGVCVPGTCNPNDPVNYPPKACTADPQGDSGLQYCLAGVNYYGSCQITQCANGGILANGVCQQPACPAGNPAVNCTAQIPNAASASFACNASGSAPLTSCTLNSCAAGYHASGGHCVLNSCVPNSTNNACGNPNIGSGVQSCSADGSQLVGSCFYTSCTGSNSPDGNGNCVPNAPSCTPNYASGFSYATPGWNAETVTGPNGSWSPGMDVAAAAVAAGTLPSAATTITVTDAVQTVTFTTGSETCNSAPYTGSSFIYNIVPVGSSGNQGWTFSFNSHDLAGSCWSRYYMSNYQVNLPRGTYQLQVIAQDSCSGGNSRCQVGWTFSSQGTTSCPAGYATPAQSVTLPWYVAPTPPSDSCDDTAWYEAHPDHCDKSASGIAN